MSTQEAARVRRHVLWPVVSQRIQHGQRHVERGTYEWDPRYPLCLVEGTHTTRTTAIPPFCKPNADTTGRRSSAVLPEESDTFEVRDYALRWRVTVRVQTEAQRTVLSEGIKGRY